MSSNGNHQFVPTPDQRRAIEHAQGPMLVVAGAGTGKTTVLARRIAHLIQTEAARPDEILAVTYTRNSASELINRVAAILYPQLDQQGSLYPELNRPKATAKLMRSGLQAHTFHSYCYRLLLDAGNKFQLLDDKDLFVLLRRRIDELKLQHYIKAATPGKFLDDLLKFFSSCHDELRTPGDYDTFVAQVERGEVPLPRMGKSKDAAAMSHDEVVGRCREVARAFRYAEDMLQQEGLGTFGHIMTRAVDVLIRRQSVLQRARRHARFILIDEFQDSNVAQIKLASLLAGEEANVFAVGDPDQAIYQFRGATSDAFDQFLRTFGRERVARVTMSANRRSTPPILTCAYHVIKCNPEIVSTGDGGWPREPLSCARLEREPSLTAAPAVHGIAHNCDEQEAVVIADRIEAMRKQRPERKLSDIAVLYRSHLHRLKIVAELQRRGIPVRVRGADLFNTPQLRDAMAALRILDSTHPVALFRVAALPLFCVDPERFRAELALGGESNSSEAALEKVPGGLEVIETIRRARQKLLDASNALSSAIEIAQRAFQLPESMPLRRLKNFAERWSEKPKQITGEGTLHEFLDYVHLFRTEAGGALVEETDEDDPVAALAPSELTGAPLDDAVQLMTAHAAKGLEFPSVFVARVTSGSFPGNYKESLVEFPQALRKNSTASDDPKTLHEQEERRLFYVSMTRAMDELYLCGKAGRERKQPAPPKTYLRELVSVAAGPLKNAIDFQLLPPAEIVPTLHAAAESLPAVSQWTQLPPREDGHVRALSASAIQQYENCPLAYKLKYDWRLPEEPSAALQLGSAVHAALKAYFDGVKAGRAPDEDTVIACFLDELSKAKFDDPVQRGLCEKAGREQLAWFLRSEHAQPRGEILETEHSFRVEIGGAKVKGRLDRLDRVDGGVAIVDYKTGKPLTQEDADKSLQLSIYALGAQDLGHIPAALIFLNLSNGTAVEARRTPQQLREAANKVAEVAAKIAAGEFEPKTGQNCVRCSYNSICPAQEAPLAIAPAQRAANVN
ncbi:MAG: ATP-dependent DNA helicase [Candidatus Korobacteraceae bacterium]